MHRLFLGTLLIACEPFGPGGAPPQPPGGQGQLHIEVNQLNFGEVSVLNEAPPELELEIRNSGTGLLKVAGLNHPLGDSEAFSSNAPPLLELKAKESTRIRVRFTPSTSKPYAATLLPNGLEEIQLTGVGLAPKLSATPEALIFESQPVGCNQQHQLILSNIGDEDLDLSASEITGSSAFVVDSEIPLTLRPGEETNSILVFSPSTGGMHSSVLAIQSNDPLHPTTVFALDALGFEGEQVSERHAYVPTGKTDFLFVLNERTSVRNLLSSPLEVFEEFLSQLAPLEWRIAISNMSTSCTLEADPWLSSADPLTESAIALHNAFNTVGPGGTSLFDKATLLLERTDPGDCLADFLQEESLLQVAFFTDQTETSTGNVQTHLSAMTNQLHDSQELSISALSGRGNSGCSDSPRLQMAAEDSNGVQLDICNDSLSNFFELLEEMALEQVEDTVSFQLEEVPVVSTLSLSFEGQPLHSWQYLSSDNRIVLNGDANDMQEGDEVLIEYLAAVACE